MASGPAYRRHFSHEGAPSKLRLGEGFRQPRHFVGAAPGGAFVVVAGGFGFVTFFFTTGFGGGSVSSTIIFFGGGGRCV